MDKRAQGLPISTIIIAILGLVVLVILFAITTGRLAIFSSIANECPGVCLSADTKGLDQQGVLESTAARNACNADTERQVFGAFIARGIRAGDKQDQGISCAKCCQRLA